MRGPTAGIYDASAWFGVGAPKNIAADILDRLNKAVNAGLADSKLNAQFLEIAGMLLAGSHSESAVSEISISVK